MRLARIAVCWSLQYILRAKRIGQVVNYTTIYSGGRLKSSHIRLLSYSICHAPFAPSVPLIPIVYRTYTVYTLHMILRFDQIADWSTEDSIVRQKLIWSIPNASFSAPSIIILYSQLHMYTCIASHVICLDKTFKWNILYWTKQKFEKKDQ